MLWKPKKIMEVNTFSIVKKSADFIMTLFALKKNQLNNKEKEHLSI